MQMTSHPIILYNQKVIQKYMYIAWVRNGCNLYKIFSRKFYHPLISLWIMKKSRSGLECQSSESLLGKFFVSTLTFREEWYTDCKLSRKPYKIYEIRIVFTNVLMNKTKEENEMSVIAMSYYVIDIVCVQPHIYTIQSFFVLYITIWLENSKLVKKSKETHFFKNLFSLIPSKNYQNFQNISFF